MKIISIFFVLFSIGFYGQNNSIINKFQLYHNGKFKLHKAIKFSVITKKDTLVCPIVEGKITLPNTNSICTILVNFKNKNYKIDEVDFSKTNEGTLLTFGLEKNLENFLQISDKFSNLYLIKNTTNTITIEKFEQAKEICFISFSTRHKNEDKISVKNYSKTVITETK